MADILHITSGDCAAQRLRESGLPGTILAWRDVLYDGPRSLGWPDAAALQARAVFLSGTTGGGITVAQALKALTEQYHILAQARDAERVVLWFDACLFDQAMLVHLLACLQELPPPATDLLCLDAFPGIEPFQGLGQLTGSQLAALYDMREPVTAAQFAFAQTADEAFAGRKPALLNALAAPGEAAPLPWVPAAAQRCLLEQPDPKTGLGRLEQLALDAIRNGKATPVELFKAVAAADSTPQFWGDTTLWRKINGLAARQPPLVRITGPAARLPQWESPHALADFQVSALPISGQS